MNNISTVRGPPEPMVAAAAAAAIKKPAAAPVQSAPVLEEWQVPLKYRRETITEEEIEFINVSERTQYWVKVCYPKNS